VDLATALAHSVGMNTRMISEDVDEEEEHIQALIQRLQQVQEERRQERGSFGTTRNSNNSHHEHSNASPYATGMYESPSLNKRRGPPTSERRRSANNPPPTISPNTGFFGMFSSSSSKRSMSFDDTNTDPSAAVSEARAKRFQSTDSKPPSFMRALSSDPAASSSRNRAGTNASSRNTRGNLSSSSHHEESNANNDIELSLFSMTYAGESVKEIDLMYGGGEVDEDGRRSSIYDSHGGIRHCDDLGLGGPGDAREAPRDDVLSSKRSLSSSLAKSELINLSSNSLSDKWLEDDPRGDDERNAANIFDSDEETYQYDRYPNDLIIEEGENEDRSSGGTNARSSGGHFSPRYSSSARNSNSPRPSGSNSPRPSGSNSPRPSNSNSPRPSGSPNRTPSPMGGTGGRLSPRPSISPVRTPPRNSTSPENVPNLVREAPADSLAQAPAVPLPATTAEVAVPPAEDAANGISSRRTFNDILKSMHPTSAAAFLRAMSICGFGNMIFLAHTAGWWYSEMATVVPNYAPSMAEVRDIVSLKEVPGVDVLVMVRWLWLIAVIAMNLLKLPFRIHTLHCVGRVFNAPDRATSKAILDSVVDSWMFRVHQNMGRLVQYMIFLGFMVYFFDEVVVGRGGDGGYGDGDEKLRDLSIKAVLDACCANLLVAIMRSLLAIGVLYTNEVRQQRRQNRQQVNRQRRGLLEREMDALQRETFTVGAEAQVRESRPICSICLDRFETGDRLWVLPCDSRHRFHGDCIKGWLARNASCPLCTRNVRGEASGGDSGASSPDRGSVGRDSLAAESTSER
jgi:hypothetical protein